VIRPFNYKNEEELRIVSDLILLNFKKRSEFQSLPSNIVRLYSEANSPSRLKETVLKNDTFGYVLEMNGEILGIIVCRFNRNRSGSIVNMQPIRVHAALKIRTEKVYGIGKTLVNISAVLAMQKGVSLLTGMATLFGGDQYFRHLGWKGQYVAKATYNLSSGEKVVLPQFQCSFEINKNFRGF